LKTNMGIKGRLKTLAKFDHSIAIE